MKTYSFNRSVSEGIALTSDEKFGPVVFLGEVGRGRRYEKVALDRHNPAPAVNNRVLECEPRKITLPAREDKPEKIFYVLARATKSSDAVLVRVNTEGVYTRDTIGGWKTLKGQPETLIAGYGAYGDAGRIGNWHDGLIVMRPGDALKVTLSGGYKFRPYALFLDASGKLEAIDFEEWEALQAIQQVETVETPSDLLYGAMPAFSFTRDTGWKLVSGIQTVAIGTGRGFKLGPKNPATWRSSKTTTVMVVGDLPDPVATAAVAKSGESLVLVKSGQAEPGKFLVRVSTQGLRKGGWTTAVVIRGEPKLLATGTMDHGTKNPIHHDDQLWVLAENDLLRIGQRSDEYSSDYALYVEGGEPKLEKYFAWEIADALKNPAKYIEKGWCPIQLMPNEWVGRVICTYNADKELVHSEFGITSVGPEPLLNMEWDRLVAYDGNPNITPWSDMVWARVTNKVMNVAPTNVQKKEEVRKRDGAPYQDGTRLKGVVDTTGKVRDLYSSRVWNHTFRCQIPADIVEVTTYEIGGAQRSEEKVVGETMVEETYQAPYWFDSDDTKELYGEFDAQVVEFKSGRRKGQWAWRILSSEKPEAEIAAMQGRHATAEAEAARLWKLIVEKNYQKWDEPRFEHKGVDYRISRNPNRPHDAEWTTLHHGSGQWSQVQLVDAYRLGVLQAWAKSLGLDEV